jgi:hypothetical protein
LLQGVFALARVIHGLTAVHRARATRELGQPQDAVDPARALVGAYRSARRAGVPLTFPSRF